jgi:transcriptional regulator with XRE-family HTH domain
MPYMTHNNQYGRLSMAGQADRDKILTPALCRAGRGFLGWTQCDLADRSGVSRSTIRDYEGVRHEVHRSTEAQLRKAFEDGGAAFVPVDAGRIALCARPQDTEALIRPAPQDSHVSRHLNPANPEDDERRSSPVP